MAAKFTRHNSHSGAQDLCDWEVRTGRYRDRFLEEHFPVQVFTPTHPPTRLLLLHPNWVLHWIFLKVRLVMLITTHILKGSMPTNRGKQGQHTEVRAIGMGEDS